MISDPAHHPRASVYTLGCRLNQSESSMIEDKLAESGYTLVPFGEPADLAVINTCTVTAQADAKARNMIRRFTRDNPDGFLAVVGCYSQMGYKSIADIGGVDLIIGNQEKLNVLDYVNLGKNPDPVVIRDRFIRDDFTIEFSGETDYSRRANLKIQDGCNFMCTFCIIPFARGRARSRELRNLMDEARHMVSRGVRELVLTGVNIGTYDYKGMTVADVVEHLNLIEGLDRIRISSIEPTTIPESLFQMMNDPDHALVPYLHIPLQSGSDRVLQLMKRRYSISDYIDFIRLADESVENVCIGTDILVGSNGETLEDFEETCRVFTEQPFAYSHVFTYSERDNTPALALDGVVPVEERQRRNAVLRRLSEKKRLAYDSSFIGQCVDVLFEDQRDGFWSGYTENYIRVAVQSEEELCNTIRPVDLYEAAPGFLLGRLQGVPL